MGRSRETKEREEFGGVKGGSSGMRCRLERGWRWWCRWSSQLQHARGNREVTPACFSKSTSKKYSPGETEVWQFSGWSVLKKL